MRVAFSIAGGVGKAGHELRGFLDRRNAKWEARSSLAPIDRVSSIVTIKQQG
jgi:hypothetical protein